MRERRLARDCADGKAAMTAGAAPSAFRFVKSGSGGTGEWTVHRLEPKRRTRYLHLGIQGAGRRFSTRVWRTSGRTLSVLRGPAQLQVTARPASEGVEVAPGTIVAGEPIRCPPPAGTTIRDRTRMKPKALLRKFELTRIRLNAKFVQVDLALTDHDRDAAWDLYVGNRTGRDIRYENRST